MCKHSGKYYINHSHLPFFLFMSCLNRDTENQLGNRQLVDADR